jgi:hypothetical protein
LGESGIATSFAFRVQPQLDQSADGFGAVGFVALSPFVHGRGQLHR